MLDDPTSRAVVWCLTSQFSEGGFLVHVAPQSRHKFYQLLLVEEFRLSPLVGAAMHAPPELRRWCDLLPTSPIEVAYNIPPPYPTPRLET